MRKCNQSQRCGLLFSIPVPPHALLLRGGVHNYCCGADERLNLGKFDVQYLTRRLNFVYKTRVSVLVRSRKFRNFRVL